ncbi:MAG TPA: CDP-alcohol phosphatidyltransferase family protein [Anaerolineaceae bacterium]|jgi:CDP-diacylglycerol--glycerol-3-phosphate 3-phosphatidyltransferase|nr:CDP-alcohol phosphatidyltransferase family protein [Anaerolineaceae bacterium]
MSTTNEEKKTFTDWLRKIFSQVLNGIGGFLNNLGIRPNVITLSGLFGNFISAALIAMGYLTWGGLLAMIIWPLDALDGTMARLRGEDSKYGSFIDSTTDRYSEIAIYGGLMIHFIRNDQWLGIVLAYLALTGSLMVSYTRAKAESLGFTAKNGWFSRAERYIVLMPGIIFRRPDISLWVLAVMTYVTALQRFLNVRRQSRLTPAEDSINKE